MNIFISFSVAVFLVGLVIIGISIIRASVGLNSKYTLLMGLVTTGIAFAGIIVASLPGEPTAIDVYRGKTQLEYTIKIVDGVETVVDSTVVFKKQ